MKKPLLFTLLMTILNFSAYAGIKVQAEILPVLFCDTQTGESVSVDLEVLPFILSSDCGAPTALMSGTPAGPFDNTGINIMGGDFNPISITNDNVQYFSVNAAFFAGGNRIKIEITPTGSPALGAHEVYIMSNCDGSNGPLAATNITGDCFAATPDVYIIMVVSEAANAGSFNITATAFTAPPSLITVSETSGNTNDDGDVCEGDDFEIEVTNDPNYTYSWDLDGVPFANTTFNFNKTNAALADDGTYSVTITDMNGCYNVVSTVVTVFSLPVVNLAIDENSGNTADDGEVCEGDAFTLQATSGATTYSWELNGAPIAGATENLNIAAAINGVTEGTYEVFYEDANGCVNSDTYDVTVNPNPVANDTELKECANAGGNGDFTLTDAALPPGFPATNSNDGADVDNGAANMTITYHTSLADAQNGASAIGPAYTAANGIIIFARVESNVTGCFTTAEVTLTVNPNPNDLEIQNTNNSNSPANFTICEGDDINLTAYVTTGQAPYTFSWLLPNGSTTTGQNYNNANAAPTIHDGVWNVTVTDANGCTDTDNITITVTPNPSNDDCADATPVNLGANNGLTNLCGTQDLTPCASQASQASVWYEYVIGPGVKTLTISVSASNHVVEIYEDNCATSIAGDCDQSVTLDCPEPQTIYIFVSSSAVNAGTFNLTITETPVTVTNDICDNAEVIPQLPECEFFAVASTTTTGACPEQFTISGCALDYSVDAIVWYEFTTPAGTTSIEIDNITSSAYLSIFTTCPVSGSPIAGGGCLSGGPAGPITVAANTTYFIAIGIDGATGNVGFDIKYNLAPTNDDPCLAGFAATDIPGSLTGEDNTCATDDYLCGGNAIENTLWYPYDLTAPNDQITITVTGLTSPSIAVFEEGNACNGTLIDENCSGNGILELTCLEPGIYNIMVGSSAANAGPFNISVSSSQNPAAPNDVCTNATALIVDPDDICVLLGPFTASNEDACPENLASVTAPCDFNDEETTWYSFTAPGMVGDSPTMDFEFTSYSGTGTPVMGLFEEGADCTNLTAVDGCNSGLNSLFGNMGPLNAGDTYYIAVSSNNDNGGDFEFEIKFNLGPDNDDPCADLTAFDISGNGSIVSTTSCAGGDPTLPACPTGDQQNVVFFKFTIPSPGARGINVMITPFGSNPFSGGIVAGVVSNACGAGVQVEAECASGSLDYDFDCLPPGDYFLQVSTSEATAGDFRLNFTEIADDGPVNDDCNKAEGIPIVDCEFVTVTGTTVNACWETFNAGGCEHGTDPTVYYTFTTPAGATEVDFANITAGNYLTILTSCTATTYVACSEDTNPFENIPIMGNTTYFITVGTTDPAGATFSFDIKVIVPPANNCTPEQIASGGSATLTSTCCATNPGEPLACPMTNVESTVWYEYTPSPTAKAVEITFASGSMTGNIGVEVFVGPPGGDCTHGIAPAPGVDPYCIAAGSETFIVRCEDFATTHIYVAVGSSEVGCGTFSLSFEDKDGCDGAEICDEIVDILTPVTDGGFACVSSCNDYNCAEPGDCDPDGASVWFQVNTDGQATSMVIDIDAPFTPLITYYTGMDCSTLGIQPSLAPCFQGSTATVGAGANQTFWIKVEALNGENLGPFTLCVATFFNTYDCYESSITSITRPDYPTGNANGPYCPGETVNFCFNFVFTVSAPPPPDGNNCQWIQGIIPTIYGGWDYAGSNIQAQGPGGGSFWLDEDMVDYNVNSTIYSIVDIDGRKGMEYGGPNAGMPAGTLLPGGWWYVSNGGSAGCTNDGDPDNMWGLPASCNATQIINFCLDLKVKELEDMVDCETERLDYSITVTADGETGCWDDLSCSLSTPLVFDGAIDCSGNITVDGEDKEICTGDAVLIEVVASESGAVIELNTIDNPNVTGETLTGTFSNSIASFTDVLVNTGTSVEEVIYVFSARGANSICKGPEFELKVTVYPEIMVEFDPTYVCEGLCTDISPLLTGGSGTYVNYQWNTGDNTSAINVCPTAPTTYFVTVTDDKGCTGTGEVEVDVKPPVEGEMDPDPLSICQDGIDDDGPLVTAIITSGTYPFFFNWDVPGGIYGTFGTSVNADDSYDLDEENSVPSTDPYEICVNVVDDFGCEVDICGEIIIDGLPEVTITYPPLVCGQNSVVLTADFDFGYSSSYLDRFELYDCEGNLIQVKTTDPSIFSIADLSANNCFELRTYTDNGCLDIKTFTILPPNGIPAVIFGTSPICVGKNSTIGITNAATYASFEWNVSGLTTPNITVTPASTTTYFVTVTEANGCTDVASFEVVVANIPTLSLQGSLSFCTGSSTTIEAISDTLTTFVWKDPALTIISDTSLVELNIGGSYTVEVTSAEGCFRDSVVNIITSDSLQISLNDLALCDGAVDTLTPGSFFQTYAWSQDGILLPADTISNLAVTAAGTYCVTVSDASGCKGTGCKVVTNSASPLVNVLQSPVEVCRLNSGVGPTFINFNSLISGSAGVWTDIEGSGVDLTNLANVSFLGVPRDTFTFRYVTNTAIVPCVNDTAFVNVIVNNCPCPTIAFQPLVACNDQSTPVNLNNYLNVQATIRSGVWSFVSGPQNAAVSTDSILNIQGIAPGSYVLNWQTNASIGACPNSGQHTITVNGAPTAAIKGNRTVCNAATAQGPSSINLDTVLVAGTTAGQWLQISGTPVSGLPLVDALGLAPGVLVFEYTTTGAAAPCKDLKVRLNVTVRDCSCPLAAILRDTLCNGSDNVDLNNLITLNPAGTPGTWSTTAPGTPLTGSVFNATGITSGSYKIRYTFTNDPGGNCDKFFEQDIVIRRQPTAVKLNDGTACNANTGNGNTVLGLNSLINATPGGTWTQVSGTPALTIPANGFVDFAGQTIGNVYEFEYSVTANAPCVPANVRVKVSVKDCDCPNVDITAPQPICNTELLFDLAALEDPNIAPGSWTVTNPLNQAVVVNPDKTFNVNGVVEGKYTLTYILNPAPSGTCDKFSTVDLTIVNEKTATIKASETVCTVDKGNNENVLDFRNFITAGWFGGTWENTDNAPVNFSNPFSVDFSNAVIGQTYTFTYRVTNTAPCENKVYTIEIEVIDCTCPPIKPGDPADVCTADGMVSLSPQYDDPANPGTWQSVTVPITNNKADVSGLASGNYTITYVVTNPTPGCPDKVDRTLTVVKVKNAGQTAQDEVCSNDPETISLANLLTGEDTGGSWKEVSVKPSSGAAFNAATGTFNTQGQSASSYQFEYSFTNQAPCPDVKQIVTINVVSAPTAQAGNPDTLTCTVAEVTLGDPTDNQQNVIYEWTHESGLPVPNADKATTKVNFGGKFTIKVTNTVTGCVSTDDVIITVDPNKPTATLSTKDVSCFNAKDGTAGFIAITGGKAPLQYSKDGGATFQNSPNFTGLNGGTYNLVIKDATGCTYLETAKINEPGPFSIDLGDDVTIALGDSVQLSLAGQIPGGAQTIRWTTTDTSGVRIICDQPVEDCIEFAYYPQSSTTVCARVVNENGCEAEDCKVINIFKARNIVFSNIIQPENFGENKTFFVESSSVAWINEMKIFDRWGNLMYSRADFPANDPSFGWNGTFNGKDVVPGVYTWVVELEYDAKGSGDVEVFSGDLTVIR
ncbi:MAG: gliding motility-associated C-terminal domain-containing protein [Saprospiraceae bacterium]|nr:gliding motility-associated C-terminal domain-containing protein [Saprospiraceae bacterium]